MSSIARKWMWAGVSGTSGLLFGGVSAMYAPEAVKKMNQTTDGPEPDGGNDIPDLPVAHVNDSMSFEDAFASAREDVGPGGVFYWHGGIYGTYYKEEWDSMSAEEKSEFGDLASNMFPEPDDPSDAIMPKDVAELPNEESAPTHEHLDGQVTGGTKEGVDDSGDTQRGSNGNEGKDMAEDNSSKPYIQEVDEDGDGVTDYYAMDTNGDGIVDQHAADTDGDGEVDMLFVDADGSKSWSEGDYAVDKEGNVFSSRGEYLGKLQEGENVESPSEDVAENGKEGNAEMTANEPSDGDDEVAIVGYGEYDGHLAVGLDTTGDGNADHVIIDVDGDGGLSPADVLMNEEGDSITLEELEDAELGMDDGSDADTDVDSNDLSDDTVFM